MEIFRTAIPPLPAGFDIPYQQKILLMGSCFAEHIGKKLQKRKFDALLNPFGVVYNPFSLASGLERLLDADRPYDGAELDFHAGLWHSWDHHGRFSGPDKEETLQRINAAYHAAADFVRETRFLVLTFGASVAYRLQEPAERIVANCHKAPADAFRKERLSTREIIQAWTPLLERWRQYNPALRVILTVSPVRHWRDGAVENQRSKASLLLACAALEDAFPFVQYFPAYELLMDDLRDYRFYAEDMLHPSEQAVNYIWQHFGQVFFSENTLRLAQRIEAVQQAAAHRPFVPATAGHQQFVDAQLGKIRALETEFPFLDFSAEKDIFAAQRIT